MNKQIIFGFILLGMGYMSIGQVVINEASAGQLLDVNGKISIKDDNEPATEGAIRYDSNVKDFEGYDGSQWNSFTMSKGLLPSGAVPCYSRVTVDTDGSYSSFEIREMADNNNAFTTVPIGKYFILTSASFTGPSSGATQFKNYTIRISGSTNPTDEVVWLQGRFEYGLLSDFSNGFAPLIIIGAGEYLRVQHPNFVDDNDSVNVFIKGWLVDDSEF